MQAVGFEIVGAIASIEVIASGRGVRQRTQLNKRYGKGHWRKLKGTAQVRLADGETRRAEVHWYEAQGIGRRRLKIKCFLD